MKNKKSNSITCSCEDPPVPFGLILSIAHSLDVKDYQYCSDKLISWMLKDSDLITADGWIEFEAQGHPVWWRAARLIEYLSIKLQDYSIDKIIYIIKTPYFPIADFITIILINRFCSNIDFEIKINSEIQSIEYLDILKEKVVNLCIQELDTLYPEISEFYNDSLIKLTGFSASEWHLIKSNNNVNIEPEIIIKSIWRYQQLGNPDIPYFLAHEIKKNCSDYELIGTLDGIIMQMKLINHQFDSIVITADPPWLYYLSKDQKNNYFFTKAYAATLSGRLSLAKTYFKLIGVNEDKEPNNLSDLYLLNIYALFLVFSKNIMISLALEHKIEKYIIDKGISDRKINYINSINIARLYRISGEFNKSESYYEKAYTEIKNKMNSSDYVYQSINYAKLFFSSKNFKKSLNAWISSAAYWLALGAPEELAIRPLCAILENNKIDTFYLASLEDISFNYLRNIIATYNKALNNKSDIIQWNKDILPKLDNKATLNIKNIIKIDYTISQLDINQKLKDNQLINSVNFSKLNQLIIKIIN